MIYNSSKGPREIADMNYRHIEAARAKLLAEEPGRIAEIRALGDEIERRDADRLAQQEGPEVPEPDQWPQFGEE